MKRRFLLSALLVSFLLWGVNSSFAQDQVKDPNVQSVKKGVVKKVEIKKDVNGNKEVVTTKKVGGKKVVITKKDGEKKVVITKKDGEKKVIITKKENLNEGMRGARSIVKDKEVGKTADGKTIYEGPRGGKYTLSRSGKKVYIK